MEKRENNGLLKFLTCGSVDDGKSTLIGHMLYDAKLIFADQAQSLALDSRTGSAEGKIDYSLLLDGLMAEREQGITIDVAYRYFSTEKRSFIVADSPGHEEYTRNMAVGASFADLAVILVDASRGVLTQTRRHTRICSLMGIRDFVFAVNKMDLILYNRKQFDQISAEIKKMTAEFLINSITMIPVSATEGDNVTQNSGNMIWYHGKPLLRYLEDITVNETKKSDAFCMPVQRICRPNHNFRGIQGQIESGSISEGDEVTVLPSGEKAHVQQILCGFRQLQQAEAGQPVTLQLDREIDVSRGCVLAEKESCHIGNLIAATLLWMDELPLVAGKNYLIKCGTRMLPATVQNIRYKTDVNTGEQIAADTIFKNEIVYCEILTAEKIVFTTFENNRELGGLLLIDRISNQTAACGIVEKALNRTNQLSWQKTDITREIRSHQKNQKPMTLWFTGLSGAGKTTIANALEKRLVEMGKHTMLLDGDNIRLGLNNDLGFEQQDRIENIRRVAEVAKLMNDAGLIVLTAFISPYESDRESAREIIGTDFLEIYISTPLEECERRDTKGLYKKARLGEISDFTGISSPYEIPEKPDLILDTTNRTVQETVEDMIRKLQEKWSEK